MERTQVLNRRLEELKSQAAQVREEAQRHVVGGSRNRGVISSGGAAHTHTLTIRPSLA